MLFTACTQANCKRRQWQWKNTACGECFFSLAWTPAFLPEKVAAPSKLIPTIFQPEDFVLDTIDKCWIYACITHFLYRHNVQKAFNRSAIFLPMTEKWQFLHCRDISALICHDTKNQCRLSLFKIDSLTNVSSASIKSATAPREVYTAFLEAFLTKTCNSLAPQDTTKSTNLVKLVEWAIGPGKIVSATYKRFHSALFFSLSCIPTICSCCTTESFFDMTSKAWLVWL